jgi:hypothetical protein
MTHRYSEGLNTFLEGLQRWEQEVYKDVDDDGNVQVNVKELKEFLDSMVSLAIELDKMQKRLDNQV